MTPKAQRTALKTAPISKLIESFVHEAVLTDPKVATTFEERERHVKNLEAYVDEIGRREELATLLPLLGSSDPWIAYCTADQLVECEGTDYCAMLTLDRLASAAPGGVSSGFANRARNMVRFGDPAGAFEPPTEAQRAFLRIVTFGYRPSELQVETCLISEWDRFFLPVRVRNGPPFVRSKSYSGRYSDPRLPLAAMMFMP